MSFSERPTTHILHVDDDPELLELTALHLEAKLTEVVVHTTTDPADAISLLDAEPIDCIVSDYALPEMNGLEFYAAIKDTVDLPFILFTGQGSEEIASEAIGAGVTDYVQKGGSEVYELLANRLQNALNRHRHQTKVERLHEVAVDLESLDRIEAVCQRTITAAEDLLSFEYCNVSLYDADRETFVVRAGSDTLSFDVPHEFDAAGTLAAETIARQESIIFDSPDHDIPIRDRFAPESGLSVPLGEYGVFQAGSGVVDAFSQANRTLAELLADHVTATIDRITQTDELQRAHDRLDILFETLPEPVVHLAGDMVNIQDVNPAFEDTFDIPATEARGQSINDLIVPPDKRDEAEAIDNRQPGGFITQEVQRVTAGGDRRDFLLVATGLSINPDSDCPEGYAIYVDITERKAQERQLQQERDRLSATFETIPEPFLRVRFEDGVPIVEEINTAFTDTFGMTQADIQGKSINDVIVAPDDRPTAQTIDAELQAGERIERELQRITADGVRDFLFRATSYALGDGRIEGIGIYVDITDHKRRERELKRKNERLDRFASIVSHDLRNPLSILNGRLELAAETGDPEHFEQCHQAVDRMEQLIDDLLVLARAGETVADPEPVELAAVVTDGWTAITAPDAELLIETDRTVLADRDRLRQALTNLLQNAVTHGGPGVTITVGDLETSAGFYLADTGPGIPADERDQVFESGYSSAPDGTGFGLSIVKEIVTAHGWEISVTDGEAGGARFEITGVDGSDHTTDADD